MPPYATQNLLKPCVDVVDSARRRTETKAPTSPAPGPWPLPSLWAEHDCGAGQSTAASRIGGDSTARPATMLLIPACGHSPDAVEQLWMIGLRFHTAAGQVVRQYYLVEKALDGESAMRIARHRAGRAGQAGRHGRAALDDHWVEVRQVRRDVLGQWHLCQPDT
jgi:hypothetical protein